jgi:RNA polymerase sigma-70 factor (ECF subfamily)
LTGNHSNIDRELLQRIANGDNTAFEKLFKGLWPQVYGTSFHLTRSAEMARDLAQEIFAKLWENRHKLAEVGNPEGYVYTVSRNLIMDFQRKKIFDTVNIDYLVQYFASAPAQSKLEYQELESALEKAVSRLSGKVAEVFRLSRYEGLSHPEIAERLNISVHSSRTYITRALQEIREYLAIHAPHSLVLILFLNRHL